MSLKGKPTASPAPLLKNAALAPVIYFDNVPVYGVLASNIEIELSARLLMPKPDGGVSADMTCVGHMRCSIAAARMLRDALDKALEMATVKRVMGPAVDDDDEPTSRLLAS